MFDFFYVFSNKTIFATFSTLCTGQSTQDSTYSAFLAGPSARFIGNFENFYFLAENYSEKSPKITKFLSRIKFFDRTVFSLGDKSLSKK